ncbi:MAG: sulfite exporter TauE/SafE family protein [Thermoleophilia bacterium]|nr:sulfite exporter TauE/SafE family protein [Thermoleophilia bacterium]
MTARLIAIGVVAGVFSALLGVGGGLLVVPLLMGLLAYPAHEATGTSLGAILVTALAGVTLWAAAGEVRPWYALLVGVPAVLGALAGTTLQRRLSGRTLTLAFAALLVIVGVWMLAG